MGKRRATRFPGKRRLRRERKAGKAKGQDSLNILMQRPSWSAGRACRRISVKEEAPYTDLQNKANRPPFERSMIDLEKKIPLIIDTDPGVDDAFCMLLANSSDRVEIRAITAVAGNVPLCHTKENARRLAGMMGLRGTRVAAGAEKPLIVPQETAEMAHGKNGMGGLELPETDKELDPLPAWDVIYEECKKAEGEMQIAAVGPLTNIAIALLKYPELKGLIKHLTIMGGAQTTGNHSPYGEFNIWADPHAAEIVFQAGVPMTMIDLDACHMSYLTDEEYDTFVGMKNRYSENFFEFMAKREEERKSRMAGTPFAGKHSPPDAVTIAALLDEDLFTYEWLPVSVETHGPCMGRTVVDYRNREGKTPNCRVVRGADRQRFVDLFYKMAEVYAK